MTAATDLAAFAIETPDAAIPDEVRALALTAIVDWIGVTVAGARTPIGQRIRDYVSGRRGTAEATLFGHPEPLPAEWAALGNGTSGHALDFDDTTHPMHAHPSTTIMPAALAIAEQTGASGRQALDAYLVGFEVGTAIARVINLGHYEAGWHATSSLGVFAATAAAARLAQLSVDQTANALGIAASASAGMRINFGTHTKPLHAGLAAMEAVLAVSLAAAGWTASPAALDGRSGYFDLYRGRGEPQPDRLLDGMGRDWAIATPHGLALKPFPACGATHPAIEAALQLRESIGSEPVARVHVGTSELLTRLLVYHDPTTPEEAKFRLEYTVASALVRGRVGLADFEPAALGDRSVREMMQRIGQSVDERVHMSTEFAAIVTVETEAGRRVEARVDLATGKNERPMTDAARRAKFVECVGSGADELWELALGLADASDITALTNAVRRMATA